jgi:hypothetical protein
VIAVYLHSKTQQHSDNSISVVPMSVIGTVSDHAFLEG